MGSEVQIFPDPPTPIKQWRRRKWTTDILKQSRGAVAQLGEHLLCKQGVTGSIPVSSTSFPLPVQCNATTRGHTDVCPGVVSLCRCVFTGVLFKNSESCWRLGLKLSNQLHSCMSHLWKRNRQMMNFVQTCDPRLFGVIWPSEQAHTVDA